MRELSEDLVDKSQAWLGALNDAWLETCRVCRTLEEEAVAVLDAGDAHAEGAHRAAASVLRLASQQLAQQAAKKLSAESDGLFADEPLLEELGRGAVSVQFVHAMLEPAAALHAAAHAACGMLNRLLSPRLVSCMLQQLNVGDDAANKALVGPQQPRRLCAAQEGVQRLTATASALPTALAALLRTELTSAAVSSRRGHLSLQSVLTPLLAPTPLPVSRTTLELLGSGDNLLLETARSSLTRHTEMLASLIKLALKGEGRDAVLEHLAALTEPPSGPPSTNGPLISVGLGGAVNACRLLLHLCRPLLKKPDPLSIIRRPRFIWEAGGARVPFAMEAPLISSAAGAFSAAPPPSTSPHVATECYFLTLRSLHTALRPLRRTFESTMDRLVMDDGETSKEDRHQALLQGHRQLGVVMLHEPLLRDALGVYVLLLALLVRELDSDAEPRMPAYFVVDAVDFVAFVAKWGRGVMFGNLAQYQLQPQLLEGLVMLLERPSSATDAKVLWRCVELMHALADEQAGEYWATIARLSGVGPSIKTRFDFGSLLFESEAVRGRLCPALWGAYVGMGTVEKLDLDEDGFEKGAARHRIVTLLQILWEDPRTYESMFPTEANAETFAVFVQEVLQQAVTSFLKGVKHLQHIREMELRKRGNAATSIEGGGGGSEGHDGGRIERLSFQEHQMKAKLLMGTMLKVNMEVLQRLASSAPHAKLIRERCAKRVAKCGVVLLEELCGARREDNKVHNSEQYRFNPRELLCQLTEVMLCCCVPDDAAAAAEAGESCPFASMLANNAAYSPATFDAALDIVRSKKVLDNGAIARFARLCERVRAAAPTPTPAAEEVASLLSQLERLPAAASQDEDYVSGMRQHLTKQASFGEGEAKVHHFARQLLQAGGGMLPAKRRRLMREMKEMTSRLPLHAEGAILVRFDELRMDAMKSIITGPAGTPYANGIFLFDVYFPSEYPNCPPQIFNCTTGEGTVEFNSALYADGKVCLSLLGTSGSGGDEVARWNSDTSSLVSVLLAIQAFILVSQPLANTPGMETVQHTDAFKHQSDDLNQTLWLHTVQHAMLAPLKEPPAGFEEAVRAHFDLKRGVLRRQCLEWLRDANEGVQPRLASAVQELFVLLDAL